MKKKIAFLFPGQGSQAVGMGRDFAENFLIAKETFQEADEILNRNLSKLIFEGNLEELTETKNSQPAIFVVSVAMLKTLMQQVSDIDPFVCSGLSLGEYTALFAAKKISFQDALILVQKRADFMNDACKKTNGAMSAVLGLSADLVEKSIHGIDGVWIANYNCPNQIVISGTPGGIELATNSLKSNGAKRVIPLQVHGAFHSGLMKDAQDLLSFHIDQALIHESSIRLVMNVPGDFVEDTAKIRKFLKDQVTHSVRWEMGVRAIDAATVDEYLEIGYGKTLLGLNKKMDLKAPTRTLEKVEDLETLACSS